MDAEIGVMRPQAKEHVEPPKAGGGKKQILPLSLQRENGPADTLILNFWPPDHEKIHFHFKQSNLWQFVPAAPRN